MTNLTESTQWADGIYQIETTDPVLGGPPNLQTKAGLSNIQAQQLAQRTAWLKARAEQFDENAKAISNLNSVNKSGLYYFGGSATGSPNASADGRLLHINQPNGEASQLAFMGSNNFFIRDKDAATGNWGNWQAIITTGNIGNVVAGDSAKLGGVDAAKHYHSDKANTSFRMGTGGDTNFDGLVYDDATNTIVAKADANKAGTDTGSSRYLAHRIHATSTGDVSPTSTNHAFEIGDFAGGNGLRADPNEILSRSGGNEVSVFWQNILQKGDLTASYWSIANASDAWLIGENFRGDTSVALGAVAGYCHRIGALAHISLGLRFSGFSIPSRADSAISTSIDIEAIANAAGWFTGLAGSGIGSAYGRFSGAGWDAPWLSYYCSASGGNGTIYISTGDTLEQNDPGSNATDLELKLQITLKVEG